MSRNTSFVFFGTSEFARTVLETLAKRNMSPSLIVTETDKPKGRGLVLTSPPTKIWAEKNGIKIYQPATLKNEESFKRLSAENASMFVVAEYGKILPRKILDIPPHKTINIHPSLLPKYRGPSPIQTAIMADDRKTGVTLIVLDEQVDHGPVIATCEVPLSPWPQKTSLIRQTLAENGAALLADMLSEWVRGEIASMVQDETKATYTKKIEKRDGLLNLSDDPYLNWRKICAYSESPGAHFHALRKEKECVIKIKDATFKDGMLSITKVVPQNGREMNYEDFLRGNS